MNNLITRLIKREHPDLSEFFHAFEFDLLFQLEKTQQEPEWHAEGNVFIHTQRVLNEVYKILDTEAKHLSFDRKLSLIFAAVLHDIGKPLVTKAKEVNGLVRIVAPYHEERGCSYLAHRLVELDIPYKVIQQVLRLVAYHHKPRHLVLHNASKKEYFHLARLVDVELLFYLAKADILGRICKDQKTQCEYIDLFRIFCEDYNLFGDIDPYEKWRIFFNTELHYISNESRDAVLGNAIRDYESGLIFTPEEAIARRYPYLHSFPQLVIMYGPSGSGKSRWIQNHLKEYQMISLDDLRKEYGKHKINQDTNSFILSKAKDKLKQHMRNHDKVVCDATNLRKDFRSMICQLGLDYHALVTLVVLHINQSSIYQGNQLRDQQVPQKVLDNQIKMLEWVEDCEAHRVAFFNRETCLDFKGVCDLPPSMFY